MGTHTDAIERMLERALSLLQAGRELDCRSHLKGAIEIAEKIGEVLSIPNATAKQEEEKRIFQTICEKHGKVGKMALLLLDNPESKMSEMIKTTSEEEVLRT